ncbi:hypothetical protein YB2330_004281 [Saitoella coloradoensis]
MSLYAEDLQYVVAPMINQSDLPFRALCVAHGATSTYTEMLDPARLTSDIEYRELHLRSLQLEKAADLGRPVIVQVQGNDPETVVKGAREIAPWADAIDLNLGCPQKRAREGHYGGYLLPKKDWPLIESVVSAMAHSLNPPTTTKIRLCNPVGQTSELCERLIAAGTSLIAIHPRHVAESRRRAGLPDMDAVRVCAAQIDHRVPVLLNGGTRSFSDLATNTATTGVDGVMVGEAVLDNPMLFEDRIPDPREVCLEYLDYCERLEGTATLYTIKQHVKRFVEYQHVRRPWFGRFGKVLLDCETREEVRNLLEGDLGQWMQGDK